MQDVKSSFKHICYPTRTLVNIVCHAFNCAEDNIDSHCFLLILDVRLVLVFSTLAATGRMPDVHFYVYIHTLCAR